MTNGLFTISLDFELFWGVHVSRTVENYGRNIQNVHVVVPRLLALFEQYHIHATWATVGLIFHQDQTSLLSNHPALQPEYEKRKLSAYDYIKNNPLDPPLHFAPYLIQQIKQVAGQEISTHTYSHIFCLEKGITAAAIRADILKSIEIASQHQIKTTSIVFPRNQYDEQTLDVCRKLGIKVFRGNELHQLYTRGKIENEKFAVKLFRLFDSYCNITGHHVYQPVKEHGMLNVRASRFLRPYSNKLSLLDFLKLGRIKRSMTYAAKNKAIYHLWWHPHNFGNNMDKNFLFLENILKHYAKLNKLYSFKSANMNEIGELYGEL